MYHLISGSKHSLMVLSLSGLFTYLLPTIYCHEQFWEPVSIKRDQQIRNKILNESHEAEAQSIENGTAS